MCRHCQEKWRYWQPGEVLLEQLLPAAGLEAPCSEVGQHHEAVGVQSSLFPGGAGVLRAGKLNCGGTEKCRSNSLSQMQTCQTSVMFQYSHLVVRNLKQNENLRGQGMHYQIPNNFLTPVIMEEKPPNSDQLPDPQQPHRKKGHRAVGTTSLGWRCLKASSFLHNSVALLIKGCLCC